MKAPSVPFALTLFGIGLLGLGGYGAFRKVQSAPEGVRLQQGFIGALFHHGRKEKPVTPADRLRMKMRQVELKQRMLAEFPQLRIEERSVAEEKNGFLQIHRLGKHPGAYQWEPRLLDELSDCVNSWNPAKARAFLAKYPAFVAEAKRIALLPAQSSTLSAEDYTGFFEARSAKSLHDVFLLQARMAAESGDEPAALESARHAMQIRDHLHDLEAPSFLTETVVILMDLGRMKWVTDVILPKLGSTVNLAAWRELMGGENHAPARLVKVVRGEWHTSADHLFLPIALADHHHGNLEDPEETAHVWSARTARRIAELESKPAIGFRDLNGSGGKSDSAALSKEGKEIVDVLDSGQPPWNKAVVRAAVIAAQHRAMLDLLNHERDGRPIPEMLDPVSGQPFRFDASTRMIHAPEWDGAPEDVAPVQLPW